MLRRLPSLSPAKFPHLVGAVCLHGPDEGVVVLVRVLLDGGQGWRGARAGEVRERAERRSVLRGKNVLNILHKLLH